MELRSPEDSPVKENPKIDSIIRASLVPPGGRIALKKDYDPAYNADLEKDEAAEMLAESLQALYEYQAKLYAQDTYALLIIFQAMDAAGKDSVIKHVMAGLNPQGTQVFSFKAPSPEEIDHDYLWRCYKALPERGRIGIFNRSYYEEVLVVRVHRAILDGQRLPPPMIDKNIWERRYKQINNFEKYLVENGIVVLKFFLNVSKDEQKRRFLERIDRPDKNWKFSVADVKERAHWKDYMQVYEDMLNETSTEWAPWHVIPADRKWFTRMAVAAILGRMLGGLGLEYPTVSEERRQELSTVRKILESEVE